MPGHSPRIVLISPNRLGQCMSALPVIRALKKALPASLLLWIAHRDAPQLTDDMSDVHSWSLWPETSRTGRLSWLMRREVRHYRADVIVDTIHDQIRTTGSPRTSHPRQHDPTRESYQEFLRGALKHSLRLLQIDEPLSVAPLPVSAAARTSVDSFLRDTHLTCTFLAVHIGDTACPTNAARFYGSVMRRLGQRRQLPSLVLYDGNEQRFRAEAAVARSGGHALLAPAWSWSEIAAVLGRCQACLTHDPEFLEWTVLADAVRIEAPATFEPDQLLALCEATLDHLGKTPLARVA